MTIRELRKSYLDGTMTVREAVDGYISRIEEKDGEIGAFLEVFSADARLEADEADSMLKERKDDTDIGPLFGIPVAVKDNILVSGKIASSGSKILDGYVSPYDATVISRLKKAGAIILGRTNMDEFACGSSMENTAYQETRNPIDTSRVPGGSSGGSAAAVAAGFCPIALGSETGGSVRQPASLCGIVGFKPTYGAVSRYGLMPLASSMDQVSTFGATVGDAAELFRVIAGVDGQDKTSRAVDLPMPEFGGRDINGLKIGVPKQFFDDEMDADISSSIKSALKKYEEAGAIVSSLDIPLLEDALAMYYVVMPAELSSNLQKFDGVRFGTKIEGDGYRDGLMKTRGALFGAEIRRRILIGSFVLSAGYVDAYYLKAVAAREALRESLREAFKEVDVIMGPTSPTTAWKYGEKFDDPLTMYLADIYTCPANLAGIPAISIPCGTVKGLPVGLQIMGPEGQDALVFDVAYWYGK
mgnify:CR=1 FL=1